MSVIDTPQGPLALPPTQPEVLDIEKDVLESDLELEMWHGMRDGYRQQYIELFNDKQRRRYQDTVSGGEVVYDVARHAQQQVVWHTPARLPEEVVHGIRRSAAKLFKVQFGDVQRGGWW